MGQILPTGHVGELCIGGLGVSRGYWNRTELTQKLFAKASFAEQGRLYRTGDLARWTSEGELEFWGRIDFQVKVRGHRIELGEIEHALEQLDGVHQAAAAVKDHQLVAYLATESALTGKNIIDHLSKYVPDALIPDQYYALPSLPLSVSGKVDRKALGKLTLSPLEVGIAYVAPKTEVQQVLAQLWAELLKQNPVGLKHDFFFAGGNSLKLVRLQTSIAREFGISLSIEELVSLRTLEAMADEIESIQLVQTQTESSSSTAMESFSI
ncbi:MAG TPA: hypothetical protein DCR93_21815 [Cytophagales bacterium]|nr:hypothetical protein [Cytophagales bacterium]